MVKKYITTSGKRKTATARAVLRAGTGKIRVNKMLLTAYAPEVARLFIQEPLVLAPEYADKVDIDVNFHGGGAMGGAEASRLAIAKALVEFAGKGSNLKERFLQYDRQLLVADVRRKETCKPNDSKARAKRQKSYR
ncbi:MAG: 30S ribosomal protein S9 [Candidatus Woesearchaeota archaeon]|nr:30S ribosomal protein S9 [Candidatus Woesearchaeota archaeon]